MSSAVELLDTEAVSRFELLADLRNSQSATFDSLASLLPAAAGSSFAVHAAAASELAGSMQEQSVDLN